MNGIFLYEGIVYPISEKKKKWYDGLKKYSGYIIKTSFDKITDAEITEKKIDIQMAIDIISLAYEDWFDIAVLLTGDGDFAPVVEKLKELGKKVELWCFKYSLANILKEEVGSENIYYFEDVLDKIRI